MLNSLLLGFGAGIAATPHCLGMCGGFPLHLAKVDVGRPTVMKQALFLVGKTFTYMFLGALASSLGVVLLKNTPLAEVAPLLRIAAGVVTLILGLSMLGVKWPLNRRRGAGKKGECGDTEGRKSGSEDRETGLMAGILSGLLKKPTNSSAFVLGLGVGFLPCPLPMAMLAAAAASQDVMHGVALMAGVGLGTMPGLLAVGLFGMGLNWKMRQAGMRLAGALVAVVGVLVILRATGGIPRLHVVDSIAPPCCQERQTR